MTGPSMMHAGSVPQTDISPDAETGFHQAFSSALMDHDPKAHLPGLQDRAAWRFAIYRNNVHRGLQEALAAAYPVIKSLVGDAFFYGLAGDYMRSENHRLPSLALYGAGFPGFLAGHAVAAQLPYLPDIARLERARLEALHAADAPVITAASLAGLEDRLALLCFSVHPAVRWVASRFPIHAIWLANQPDRERAGSENIGPENTGSGNKGSVQIANRAEAVLVARPHYTVTLACLDDVGAEFARYLLAGQSVGAAYDAALAQDTNFDVTPVFAQLLASGIFGAFTLSEGGS